MNAVGSNLNALRTDLDYVPKTSNQNVVVTTEGTAVAVITGTSQAYAAEKVIVEAFLPQSSGAVAHYILFRDATILGRADHDGAYSGPVSIRTEDTPSAATFAYSLKAFVNGGTCTVNAGTGGSGNFLPGFLRVKLA